MRKVVRTLVALVLCGAIWAIVFPVFTNARMYSGPGVHGHLSGLYYGLRKYASDNDGRLPFTENWMDAVKPHVNGSAAFKPRKIQYQWRSLGPAFFAPLSGQRLSEVKNPETVPLLFMSESRVRNAHGDLSLLAPLTDERHSYAVLFADGKVRLMRDDWRHEVIVIELPK